MSFQSFIYTTYSIYIYANHSGRPSICQFVAMLQSRLYNFDHAYIICIVYLLFSQGDQRVNIFCLGFKNDTNKNFLSKHVFFNIFR